MSEMIVRTNNVTKTYGKGAAATEALRGVSLSIPKGSFTCLVGPSGHGKSTLMHLIGGLDRPTGGTIYIDGEEITGLDAAGLSRIRSRKIGFVFQFFNLLRGLSAIENIETALMLSGRAEKGQGARAQELLDQVGLSEKANAYPSELSGGQQQRVAIARALANNPDLLLMDEPTGNLDSAAEAQIIEILESLNQQGKTIVIVTHNLEIARRAQNVVQIKDGKIAA